MLNHIVGRWQISAIYNYTSGAPLIFTRNAIAPASVKTIGQIGMGSYWFDTTGFAKQTAYTRRTNPWYFDGLLGLGFKNMDLGLSKRFVPTEWLSLQVHLDPFNALNGMNGPPRS